MYRILFRPHPQHIDTKIAYVIGQGAQEAQDNLLAEYPNAKILTTIKWEYKLVVM